METLMMSQGFADKMAAFMFPRAEKKEKFHPAKELMKRAAAGSQRSLLRESLRLNPHRGSFRRKVNYLEYRPYPMKQQ